MGRPDSRHLVRRVLLLIPALAVALALWIRPLDIKARVEGAASVALGGQVRIGNLRWRFPFEITALGVTVEKDGRIIGGVERVRGAASVPALLRGRIVLDSLVVEDPFFRLQRGEGGLWNLPALNINTDASSREKGRGWPLEVRAGVIRSGRVEVDLGDACVRMDSLNLDFGIRREAQGHALLFRRVNTVSLSPPLVIRRIDASAVLEENSLVLKGLDLRTEASHLQLEGGIRNFEDPHAELFLRADTLDSDEVRRIFPGFLGSGPIGVNASVKGAKDALDLVVASNASWGRIEGEGRLNLSSEEAAYDLNLRAEGIDLSRLEAGMSTNLNLAVSLKGKGLAPRRADLTGSVAVRSSALGGVTVDSSTAGIRLKDGVLSADGRARVDGLGEVNGQAWMQVAASPPRYGLQAEVRGADLGVLSNHPWLRSNLSGRLVVEGSGLAPENRDLTCSMTVSPSTVGGRRIDALEARGSYRGRLVRLESLVVRTPAGEARASGQAAFPEDGSPVYGGKIDVSDLDLAAVSGDPALQGVLNLTVGVTGGGGQGLGFRLEGRPSTLFDIPVGRFEAEGTSQKGIWRVKHFQLWSQAGDAAGSGAVGPSDEIDLSAEVRVDSLRSVSNRLFFRGAKAWGKAQGRIRDLRIEAAGGVDSLSYEGYRMRAASLSLDVRGLDLNRSGAGMGISAQGDVTLRIENASRQLLSIHDLTLGLLVSPKVADLGVKVKAFGGAQLGAAAQISLEGDGLAARLDTLFVDAGKVQIRSEGTARLRYAYGGDMQLEGLRLTQAGGALAVDGRVDGGGRLQGEMRLERIDLVRWEDLLGRQDGLSGLLSLSAKASGRLEDPEVSGSLGISDGSISEFAFKSLSGTFGYGGRMGKVDLLLEQEDGTAPGPGSGSRQLTLRGTLPRASDKDGPLDLRVRADDIDLSFLQAVFPDLRKVEGRLQVDLALTGTLGRPSLQGSVDVESGRFEEPTIGFVARDASLRLEVKPDRLLLSNLTLRTKRGALTARGSAEVDGLRPKKFDVDITADDFDAWDGKDTKLSLSGRLNLTGDPGRPVANGEFTVNRALLPVPGEDEPAQAPASFWDSEFVRDLVLHCRFRVPRNAWLRSQDLNAELTGEIEVAKEGPGFVLFGELEAIRGQYVFQNAAFSIDRGQMRFQGTPDNDPNIYLVGSRRIPRALPNETGKPNQDLLISVVVGGTLSKPEVSLQGDASTPLEQSDLLSYLFFGRPANQSLMSPGGGGSGQDLQAQAQNLALGIAANRLKHTVGRELGLDVLEVELGKGGEAVTRIEVGKYVRKDLLLTFSQDYFTTIGEGSDRLGRKVSVEYQFDRHFGMSGSVDDQKKTALELFWKEEW